MATQGFIIIDKPTDWTSHDVVAKMRGILRERKIGHLGTLDPLATGVLVLAVGRDATKQVQNFMKLDKEYEVKMELGKVSDTFDMEGEVKSTGADIPALVESGELTESKVKLAMARFWGKTMQMPPAFSAKKVGGKKAYELARAGKPVDLKPVEVTMQGTDIVFDPPFVTFRVTVTSGCYVRSLVNDIGAVLQCGGGAGCAAGADGGKPCGAVLVALRRTRVGDFKIEDAKKMEDF
ncbi:MAG: tRNA pseudouridine(55) synthase TruB [Candidatus Gracilibacteria bacterium]|jgi:tRNA pseudouridine55 synthase